MRPPRDAPRPLDKRLMRTVTDMTLGAEPTPNQFKANIVGHPKIKIFPIAAKTDPSRQRAGWPGSINVLIHTPAMVSTAPRLQPTLMPYLSSIQEEGKAQMGCKTGKSKVFKVTSVRLIEKTS